MAYLISTHVVFPLISEGTIADALIIASMIRAIRNMSRNSALASKRDAAGIIPG